MNEKVSGSVKRSWKFAEAFFNERLSDGAGVWPVRTGHQAIWMPASWFVGVRIEQGNSKRPGRCSGKWRRSSRASRKSIPAWVISTSKRGSRNGAGLLPRIREPESRHAIPRGSFREAQGRLGKAHVTDDGAIAEKEEAAQVPDDFQTVTLAELYIRQGHLLPRWRRRSWRPFSTRVRIIRRRRRCSGRSASRSGRTRGEACADDAPGTSATGSSLRKNPKETTRCSRTSATGSSIWKNPRRSIRR